MLPTAFGAGLVALVLVWTSAGARRERSTVAGPLGRQIRTAALPGLLVCLALVPVIALTGLPPWVGGLAAGAAVCLHAALDPRRVSFWHHKRVRPIGAASALAAGAGLGAALPWPELAPALAAAAIFHLYLRSWSGLAGDAQEELVALRQKILTLESKRRLSAVLREAEGVDPALATDGLGVTEGAVSR